VFVTSMLATAFEPASRSSVPALVPKEELLRANAWMGTALNLKIALGPFLGGLLVSLFGAPGALAANAASFLLSAALIAGLPSLRAAMDGGPSGFLAVGKEGLAFAWRNALVRALVVALLLGVAFAALDNVALVFLTRDVLGASAFGFGVVAAAFGVGLIAGSLTMSWWRRGIEARPLYLAGWLLNGAGTLFTGFAPTLAVAALTQVIAGLGNAMTQVAGDTLVQQTVPAPMLGRVFGLVSTAAFGGGTIAYATGGVLLDLTTPRTVFVVAGMGTLGVLALMIPLLPKRR
jgi:MFS family permease